MNCKKKKKGESAWFGFALFLKKIEVLFQVTLLQSFWVPLLQPWES